MQAFFAKCSTCDVPLASREQFVGHMIHSHDASVEDADIMWRHACTG